MILTPKCTIKALLPTRVLSVPVLELSGPLTFLTVGDPPCNLIMRYHRLSVISVLTVVPLACLATPLAQPWANMRVKHAWNAVPANWESLGPPPLDTTIDLYVSLKPQDENALIDALYAVSTPSHPKYVLSNTTPRTMHLCTAAPLQIWRTSVRGGGR